MGGFVDGGDFRQIGSLACFEDTGIQRRVFFSVCLVFLSLVATTTYYYLLLLSGFLRGWSVWFLFSFFFFFSSK